MSKQRSPKYQKRVAKQATFPYKAKHNIYTYFGGDTNSLMFIGGNVYNMTVRDMYSYTAESEIGDSTFISREWLKDNFEEVQYA